jgi:hypothetical protein
MPPSLSRTFLEMETGSLITPFLLPLFYFLLSLLQCDYSCMRVRAREKERLLWWARPFDKKRVWVGVTLYMRLVSVVPTNERERKRE